MSLDFLAHFGSATRLSGFLGQKNGLDVGKDSSLRDGDSGEKFVQFLVIPDSQLEVSWNDSSLLVVTGSIASQFQNLSSQVLEDSSQVDWSTSTDSFGIVTLPHQTVDSTDGELESCTG